MPDVLEGTYQQSDNEAIFGASGGTSTHIGQEEVQSHLSPHLYQFPPTQSFLLLLTTCADPVRIELDCQGAARAIWLLGTGNQDHCVITRWASHNIRAR